MTNSVVAHGDLLAKISKCLFPGCDTWRQLENSLTHYLAPKENYDCEDFFSISKKLTEKGVIGIGNYGELKAIFKRIERKDLIKFIEETEIEQIQHVDHKPTGHGGSPTNTANKSEDMRVDHKPRGHGGSPTITANKSEDTHEASKCAETSGGNLTTTKCSQRGKKFTAFAVTIFLLAVVVTVVAFHYADRSLFTGKQFPEKSNDSTLTSITDQEDMTGRPPVQITTAKTPTSIAVQERSDNMTGRPPVQITTAKTPTSIAVQERSDNMTDQEDMTSRPPIQITTAKTPTINRSLFVTRTQKISLVAPLHDMMYKDGILYVIGSRHGKLPWDLREYNVTGGDIKHIRTVPLGGDQWCLGVTSGPDSVFVSCWNTLIYRQTAGRMAVFKSLEFHPNGLAYHPDKHLLVCGGHSGLYSLSDRGQLDPIGLQLDVNDTYLWFIAVNNRGDVGITDRLKSRVYLFDRNFSHVKTYKDSETGEKFDPWGITADKAGDFIIADRYNIRLVKISPDGKHLGFHHANDDCNGRQPRWVTTDETGRLFVGFDSSNDNICVYDMD